MKLGLTKQTLGAGLIHLLTASGALVALLALQAVFEGRAEAALLWLLVALVIDGIDGPLARRFNVADHMPQIDGVTLDLIIDFLNYVFVPIVFVWHFELFPAAGEFYLLSAILLSSLYLFVYTDMKGQDNYFNGFPAAWNLIVVIWFVLGTSPLINAISTAVLCILTFVPMKSIHPMRVARLNVLNIVLVSAWVLLSAVLIVTHGTTILALTIVWSLVSFYFLGISLWRTFVG